MSADHTPTGLPRNILILVAVGTAAPLAAIGLVLCGVFPWRLDKEQSTALIWITLALLDLGLFLVVGFVIMLQRQQTHTGWIKRLSTELGAPLERSWGKEGSFSGLNLFGFGPCYRGSYQGKKLVCAQVTVRTEGWKYGSGLTLFHREPLGLGLFGKFAPLPRWFPDIESREKRLLSRKVRIADPDFQCWAVRRKRVRSMFGQAHLIEELNRSRRLIEETKGGLVVTDRSVTAVLADDSQVSISLVGMLGDLSESFLAARTAGRDNADVS